MVSQSSKSLLTAVMSLPANERKMLVEELLRSMESEHAEALEKSWLREVTSRFDAYREGRLVAEPIDSLLEEMDRGLAQ